MTPRRARPSPRERAESFPSLRTSRRDGCQRWWPRRWPVSALHRELFAEANPIPVKWLLAQMGLIGTGVRLPLTPLAPPYQAGVRSAARLAGVLS